MRQAAQVMQGTLELMVLKSVSVEQMNGFAIAQRIKARSRDEILIEEGALYPALHRLERRGLLVGEWGVTENNRRARFYKLTAAGRRELRVQEGNWKSYVRAVNRVLQPA